MLTAFSEKKEETNQTKINTVQIGKNDFATVAWRTVSSWGSERARSRTVPHPQRRRTATNPNRIAFQISHG